MSLPLNPKGGWHLIEPRGERYDATLKCFVIIDQEAIDSIIANFKRENAPGFPGLPIWGAPPSGGVRAVVGRATKLESRDDGLWGFIEMNPSEPPGDKKPGQQFGA